MTKLVLNGCGGKMGRVIAAFAKERDDCEIVAGADARPPEDDLGFPVFGSLLNISVPADVLVDFSHPSALTDVLRFAREKQMPAVIATTGMSPAQIEEITAAAASLPLFFCANMSLGINLLTELAKIAASVLGDQFDVEIIEAHHNQKLDAPSGTALMLADAISGVREKPTRYEYDRHSQRKKRDKQEIGIHSVRGGTIVGEHQVIFAGRDEILTLSHSARSKEIFAVGALGAAVFLKGRAPGLYTMADLVAQK